MIAGTNPCHEGKLNIIIKLCIKNEIFWHYQFTAKPHDEFRSFTSP